MTELYIHIGMTKTGSTSIQKTLFHNRELLSRYGIEIFAKKNDLFAPNDLPAVLDEKYYLEPLMSIRGIHHDKKSIRSHRKNVINRLEKLIKNNKEKKIVISSETLSSISKRSVKKLHKRLQKLDGAGELSIKIICYIRDPLGWINSSFQQEIKARGRTIDNPIDLVVPYKFYLKKYMDEFGKANVDVRVFDVRRFRNGSIFSDFLDAIGAVGVPSADIEELRFNESVTLEAANLISVYNRKHPLYDGLEMSRTRALGFQNAFNDISGRKFNISTKLQREILKKNRDQLKWLFEAIGRKVFTEVKLNREVSNSEYSEDVLLSISETINKIMIENQRLKARVGYAQGLKLANEDRLKDAAEQLKRAIKFNPEFKPAQNELKRLKEVSRQRKQEPKNKRSARSGGSITKDQKAEIAERRKKARELEDAGVWAEAVKEREIIFKTTNRTDDRFRLIDTLFRAGAEERSFELLIATIGTDSVPEGQIRRGISRAVQSNDMASLRKLGPLYEAMLEQPGREPHNDPNSAVWHGLIKLDALDSALTHMNAPPVDGLRSRDRGDVAVIDPAFAPDTGHGHHFNNNALYLDVTSRLGASATFYGAHGLGLPPSGYGFDFRPVFTTRMYAPRRAIEDADWLRHINAYFREELNRQAPRDASMYVFHSVRHTIILGLAQWLVEIKDERPPVVIGVIDSDLGAFPGRADMIRGIYSQAFDQMKQLRREDVLIYCETQSHIDLLRSFGGADFDIRLFPYVASSLALTHAQPRTSELTETSEIRLGFLGGTRLERGADLIPPMIRATREKFGGAVGWVVQLDVDALKRHTKGSVDADLAAIAADEGVELIDGRVSVEDYFGMLDRTDIVVLPYRPRYEVTGSGVFIEALTLGKVQVLPERGWMAQYARRLGCDPVTFRHADFESVLAAVNETIERYPELRRKALKAAETWNSEKGSTAQLEAWLRARNIGANPSDQDVVANASSSAGT